MADGIAGKLQIYLVEGRQAAAATCVVRCVGGVVRVGDELILEAAQTAIGDASHVTLEWIDRYGREMDFIDPPHNARVGLGGEAVANLKRGSILGVVVA